jgi:hypothetical protein
MIQEQMVMILSKLIVGSVATFLSIVLWSKTRDTAWMFIVLGTIVAYGEIVFVTLRSFGVVEAAILMIGGVSLFEIVLANLPVLFYSVAFVIMILRRTVR